MSSLTQEATQAAAAETPPERPNVLARIEAYKRREIAEAKLRVPLAKLERRIAQADPVRGFAAAIRAHLAADRPALIAEIKKASPVEGPDPSRFRSRRPWPRPTRPGARPACRCSPTSPRSRGGRNISTAARAACALPVLRKDFLFEPYQVYEARAWGADCILAIMACLDDDEAVALVETAHLPRHGRPGRGARRGRARARAIPLGTALIGINNRNLKTFEVSFETAIRLAPASPADRIAVAESGIGDHADVTRLRANGLGVVLVGESLMRQADVTQATRALLFGDAETKGAEAKGAKARKKG